MIRQLPQEVINQIAAGEVVERPASIVKELIENSLDAGATRIEISILDGGKEEVRIADNGTGIEKDDLEKVFWPHATSKIQHIEDLSKLYTMGFRGEALASIASVSEVVVSTRTKNSQTGYRYQVSGGKSGTIQTITKASIGTEVIVRKLFYTVPVRMRFIKTQSTEVGHISKVIENVALANPEIEILYTSQNRVVHHFKKSTPEERAAQVFALASPDPLLQLDYLGHSLTITGLLGHPSVSRKNSQGIRVFVNSRPIQHSVIQKAILSGYDTLLEVGYYPLCAIFLTINPAEVDVNVHPRKMEVKFRDERQVFRQVREGVKSSLQKSAFSSIINPIPTKNNFSILNKTSYSDKIYQPNQLIKQPQVHEVRNPFRLSNSNYHQDKTNDQALTFRELLKSDPEDIENFIQVFDTYILYRNQDGIMVFDQHAVHEKVLLEQFINFPETIRSQQLFIPISYTVGQVHKAIVEPILNSIPGFVLDESQSIDIVVTAVPTFFQKLQGLENRISELIDLIIEADGHIEKEDIRTEIYKTIACKSAIKAGKFMNKQEVNELIKQALKTDFGFSCCHGRPTMIQLNQDWFEKQFSRK